MTHLDKNNKQINLFDEVLVPTPNETDIHNFEFAGTAWSLERNGNVIVTDGDDNYFEIEANRLTVITE